MGKIAVHEFITLDGVIESPTWSLSYPFDPEMGVAIGSIMGSSKAILLGRQTSYTCSSIPSLSGVASGCSPNMVRPPSWHSTARWPIPVASCTSPTAQSERSRRRRRPRSAHRSRRPGSQGNRHGARVNLPGTHHSVTALGTRTTVQLTRLRRVCFARPFTRGNSAMAIDPSTTAVVLIEYQNDFTSDGGVLHGAVEAVMEKTGMLDNTKSVVAAARDAGSTVMHAPISFVDGYNELSAHPYGILKGVVDGHAFVKGRWGAAIVDDLAPAEGDIVIEGKRGLDTFASTNLDFILRSKGIKTIFLGGFLTNCCVESTMRTGYDTATRSSP
jgi:nicotinamidase-related amidase